MLPLREYVEGIAEITNKIFAATGEILPMYHAVDKNGSGAVFPSPPLQKDAAIEMVREILQSVGATRVSFISEAWVLDSRTLATIPDVKKIMREGIAEHPDRIEVVMITVEDINEGFMMASLRIIRDGDKPTLGTLDFLPPEGRMEGRMVGLLPRETETRH